MALGPLAQSLAEIVRIDNELAALPVSNVIRLSDRGARGRLIEERKSHVRRLQTTKR